jgi:cytochrome c peroxidase
MSLGIRDTAEVAVRSGFKHIQFAACPDRDAVDIDAYLESLTPVPSPHLVRGKLSDAAQRGRKVFDTAGCASCHGGALFTGLQAFDLGLGKGMDTGKKFMTSTLVEIWRTAPYLHDGRAATMMDVLTKHNPADGHGKTTALSKEQLADLVEYVLSL